MPAQPIELIVPFRTDGVTDLTARVLARHLRADFEKYGKLIAQTGASIDQVAAPLPPWRLPGGFGDP